MATAQDIIDSGLKRSNLIAISQTPTSEQNSVALELLNDMIASWKSEGLDLQLDTLAKDDTVYLDASDLLCLKMNLAVMLSDHFKMQMPATVLRKASDLYDALVGKYLESGLEEMELPAILAGSTRYDIEAGQ